MSEKTIYDLYRGFEIVEPLGNNAFSFNQRRNKSISVAPLRKGTINDVHPGNKIAFCEVEEGQEQCRPGLEAFIHIPQKKKDIFIFDNHNHAFCFWMWGLDQGKIKTGSRLLHIDQHKDLRSPKTEILPDIKKPIDLARVFYYTNYELNVGNFIQPALDLGLFSEMITIMDSADFMKEIPLSAALDIDLDIFAPELDYIDPALKLSFIRQCIDRAAFITIATSPYFIDQDRAIHYLKQLFT